MPAPSTLRKVGLVVAAAVVLFGDFVEADRPGRKGRQFNTAGGSLAALNEVDRPPADTAAADTTAAAPAPAPAGDATATANVNNVADTSSPDPAAVASATANKPLNDIPSFDKVEGAREEMHENLQTLSGDISDADNMAKATMERAVIWKKMAAVIPDVLEQVHKQAKTEIWMKMKEVYPEIAKDESAAMEHLLKDANEDIGSEKINENVAQPDLSAVSAASAEIEATAQGTGSAPAAAAAAAPA